MYLEAWLTLFLIRCILLYERVGENTKQTNVKSQMFAPY